MGANKLKKLMIFFIVLGLSTAALGLGLALFTDKVSHGDINDILLIALLIAGGLLISALAKIYLTFMVNAN